MQWTAPSEKDPDNAALEKRLWDAANQLWAGAGLKQSEYSEPVLGLIFLRFAEVRSSAQRAKMELPSTGSSPTGRGKGEGAPLEKLPRVTSLLGDIPQGWEVKPLESLMIDHIGGGWGKDVADDTRNEPAWVIRGAVIPDARNARVAGVPYRFHTVYNLLLPRLLSGQVNLTTN